MIRKYLLLAVFWLAFPLVVVAIGLCRIFGAKRPYRLVLWWFNLEQYARGLPPYSLQEIWAARPDGWDR